MKASIDPLNDAKKIKESISNQRDMNKLINIIAHRSHEQIQEILKSYSNVYNKDLIKDLKLELSGNFQKTVISLFYTPVDYDCYQLNKAVGSLFTDEDCLIEIISTRSNERIKEIQKRFPEMFDGNQLIRFIESKTSGYFRKILIKLLEGKRSNNSLPNEIECNNFAMQLKQAEAKEELMEEIYMKMFTEKSREEFILITKIYHNLYKETLLQRIEKLFSGDIKKLFKAIIYYQQSPSEYFAFRINKAIESLLTKDKIIIRVLVSRHEIDIGEIKKSYKEMFKKDLYTTIEEKISGDYRNLLLALIGI